MSVEWADESKARHWIDRYAAGLDEEPQMDRILACVRSGAEAAATIERLTRERDIAQGNTDAAIADYNDALAQLAKAREALAGLLAIDGNTEPLIAKTAWLEARAALAPAKTATPTLDASAGHTAGDPTGHASLARLSVTIVDAPAKTEGE